MRLKIKEILILSLLLSVISLNAQSSKQKKADKYYYEFAYDKAASLYESLPEKTPNIYRNLAKSYVMLGELDKAEKTYQTLMNTGKYIPEDVYNYAKVLLMNKKYDMAADWMQKYYKLNPEDSRAKRFMEDPDYYKELVKPDSKIKLSNSDINTAYQDFSAVYYGKDAVVFTSSRDKKLISHRNWNGNRQPYLDLYIADLDGNNKLSNPRKFIPTVNKKYHDGPATFNEKGDYMVVTRNVYDQKNLEDNKLMLYDSNYDGTYWSDPKSIETLNSLDYSTGQASLSPDGQVMYFASDRPGGFGGVDIYRSKRNGDGSWGPAENLGPEVNTEGNEMFPFYDAKGNYLFYSSDGLPGLGGLDIFVTKVRRDGSFTEPLNMGAPINSNADDFGFVYKEDGTGFLSSNRVGGKGDDDIYSFSNLNTFKNKVQDCYISGVVKDKENGEILSFSRVYLFDNNGKQIDYQETKLDGKYEFPIDCDGKYKLVALQDGYIKAMDDVDASMVDTPNIVKDFALLKVGYDEYKKAKDMCSIHIKPIYYDLDKFYIRYKDKVELDKIVELLNKYPDMVLEIGSHTDSRATKQYNVQLSKNRTNSVVKYLINHGINKDRLVPKWFGEIYPVNGCVDGVKCSEAEHQLNRRTEFKILNCVQ